MAENVYGKSDPLENEKPIEAKNPISTFILSNCRNFFFF